MMSRSCVKFSDQDDKAKMPVGDFVSVSSGVHIKHKVIVPVADNVNMAAEYDWSKANIIPSVTLLGNIPDSYDGSFYGRGKDGDNRIYVVLRDATFDASDVFAHSAQLSHILANQSSLSTSDKDSDNDNPCPSISTPHILLLQIDGGPDHNLNFLQSKIALIVLFLSLDADHVFALRGALNGSYLNIVERCMSLLNLGLQNLALIQRKMSPWAEDTVKNFGSMNGVRNAAALVEQHEKLIENSRLVVSSAINNTSPGPSPCPTPVARHEENVSSSLNPTVKNIGSMNGVRDAATLVEQHEKLTENSRLVISSAITNAPPGTSPCPTYVARHEKSVSSSSNSFSYS